MEDLAKMQVKEEKKEEQQRLSELKSQKTVKNFIYIQDPESMQHLDLKRSRRQQMSQLNIGKTKVPGPNNIKSTSQRRSAA